MKQELSLPVRSKTCPHGHPVQAIETQTGHRVQPAAQLLTSEFKKRRRCEGEATAAPRDP